MGSKSEQIWEGESFAGFRILNREHLNLSGVDCSGDH